MKELTPEKDTLPFVGAALQEFIAGWDEGECLKVSPRASLRVMYILNKSMKLVRCLHS